VYRVNLLVAGLLLHGVGCEPGPAVRNVACDEPATQRSIPSAEREFDGPTRFVDVTSAAGVDWTPASTDWETLVDNAPELGEDYNQWGGFSVGDFDGDGHLDVLFTNRYEVPKLFLGLGGMRFAELASEEAGLTTPPDQISGASAADFDGDGDLDVLLVGRKTVFLENKGSDGGPLFVPSTAIQSPFETPTSIELSASWADVDRDGDLDVYIANWGWDPMHPIRTRDRLLLQTEVAFEDHAPDLLPEEYDGAGYVGGWTDIDEDDDLDLLIVQEANQNGEGATVFLRNDGGTGGDLAFTAETVGLEVPGRAMGLGLGDYDLDGDIDAHVTDIGATKLFEQRNGSFVDTATASFGGFALGGHEGSWSTGFLDMDNNTSLELYTAVGVLANHALDDHLSRSQTDRVWLRSAEGDWSDISASAGLNDEAATRAALAVDLNRDGCVDLLSVRLLEGPRLMQGVCPAAAAWITVDLAQGDGNPNAIGARVEAHADAEYLGVREVYAGSVGVYTSGPPEVRFGLADHDVVDLRVRWPDGTRTCNADVPTRSRVTLER
jgi:enediyne biosynthesis protein E4